MDLRCATFDLIYRDVVLRPLLVAYADRLEHGHAREGAPVPSCFVRLRWAAERSAPLVAEGDVLAVEAHMPRHTGTDDGYLDFVLQRLTTALSRDASVGAITTRCVEASPRVRESPFGTLFSSSTFAISYTSPQRQAMPVRKLVPWTGWAHVDPADVLSPGGGTPTLN